MMKNKIYRRYIIFQVNTRIHCVYTYKYMFMSLTFSKKKKGERELFTHISSSKLIDNITFKRFFLLRYT